MKKLSLLLLGMISTFFLFGQTPGTLDLTFGNDGIVMTDHNDCNNFGLASVIQDDGKIVFGGNSYLNDQAYPTFARYMPDGSLDDSFGEGGISFFIPFSGNEWIKDIILQPDGKILAIGHVGDPGLNMSILRLNPNGSLDHTFNNNGRVLIDFQPSVSSFGFAIALQEDGKIIAVGYLRPNGYELHSAFCRLNTDGIIDTTFGSSGQVIMNIGDIDNYTSNIAFQGNKFIIGGISYDPIGQHEYITLCRYNDNGFLDVSFGQDGIANLEINLYASTPYPRGDMCLDEQGRILYGVYERSTQNDDFAVYRFLPDGTSDDTFGNSGSTITGMDDNSNIDALIVQVDGKIIAAGNQSSEDGNDFALVRYLDNGDPDSAFGTSGTGIVITNASSSGTDPYSIICSLNMQEDGKIIAAGQSISSFGDYDFAVARYYSGLGVGIETTHTEFINLNIYPNPVSDQAVISFSLNEPAKVRAEVINATGTIVENLTDEFYPEGEHQLRWDDSDVKAGVYIIKMTVGDMVYTEKVVKK